MQKPPPQAGQLAAPIFQAGIRPPTGPKPLTERAQRILDKHLVYHVYAPELEAVPVEAAKFIDAVLNYDRPRWLSLLGPSGCGKTFINKQIVKLLAKWWRIRTATGHRGPQMAHLQPAADLDDYKAAKHYAAYDLIFVEDIGAGSASDKGAAAVTRSRVADLLQLRSDKWTLLDANLYQNEIAAIIDPRIASRIIRDDSVAVQIPPTVPDYATLR